MCFLPRVWPRALLALGLLLLLPIGVAWAAKAPAFGTWTTTGDMNVPRQSHTLTLLSNGDVLAAGGLRGLGIVLDSAEIYNPTTGRWLTSPSMSMTNARDNHTATRLHDGKVLVAGGYNSLSFGSNALASAELFDPHTETWSLTGSMGTARGQQTATLLHNGDVLVAGGFGNQPCPSSGCFLDSAELYIPKTGTWRPTGSLKEARYGHTATLLPNGEVLVAGGTGAEGPLKSAELYDPRTGKWTMTNEMNEARQHLTAVRLHNGQVLVSGGCCVDNTPAILASTELYTPPNGKP